MRLNKVKSSLKLKIGYIISFLLIGLLLNAQIPNNSWRDHLAYNNAISVCITPEKVYCAMLVGGMLSFNKSSGEIEKLSKVTGLSDINIGCVAYSDAANVLVIAYKNGNIDLLTEEGLINMPDIKRKQITGLKEIYDVIINGTTAYLACSFGIVEIDLIKMEISDSYFFGPGGTSIKVNDIAVVNNTIYAATESGIYRADLDSPNLVDYLFWNRLDFLPNSTEEFKLIELFKEKLYAVHTNTSSNVDEIISIANDDTWNYWNPVSETTFNQISSYNNQLSLVAENYTYFFNAALQQTQSYYIISGRQALSDTDGTIYAAASFRGFLRYKGAEEYNITVNGPRFNTTGFIKTKDDYVWVGSGGYYNQFYEGAAHNFYDENWTSLSGGYTEGIDGVGNFSKFAYHPTIDNYVYASAYLYALYEIHGNEVVAKHDRSTSSVLNAGIDDGVGMRIMDLAFDQKGDLWTVNDETTQPVFVLRDGKEWEHLTLSSSIFKSSNNWRALIVTETNQVWLLSSKSGIVVLQEQSDGLILEKHFSLQNQDGEVLTKAYCMVEDKNGSIWVGTNKGPIVFSSDNEIFNNADVRGIQPTLDRNDGSGLGDFLLDYITINDIAIDGGNRKWLATASSGVYLVSEDGTKTLQELNFENSPLISNDVISVGIQEKTGEVFISTSEGLVGFMGRATEGLDDFTDVYVYPNPVRPNYEGDITISGLIEDANVKITDVSGNLVFETTSLGGQAIWDGKNFDGNRVHSGVYLVFMTNDDGSKTHITKLVFIH